MGLIWISSGLLLSLSLWRGHGVGLPLIPLIAVQHYVVYGLPILSDNPVVFAYPEALLNQAGFEVFLFLISSSLAWRFAQNQIRWGSHSAHAIRDMSQESGKGLARIGLLLIAVVTGYNLGESSGLLGSFLRSLPAGTQPVIAALTKASSIIGYFLVGLYIGSKPKQKGIAAIYWLSFSINAFLGAASLLLSSASILVAACVIGLFWGSGRMPWRFLAVMGVVLSFFHIGKADMRRIHWTDESYATVSLENLPSFFTKWAEISWDIINVTDSLSNVDVETEDSDSMVNRVNNLQNLVYAIDAIDERGIAPLRGDTYKMVPSLLIPRIFWPDKPRAHAGQVMLNVHFGRQTLEATFRTYVAWGILPEAYGNFGRFWGSIILGITLGIMFAWLEKKSAPKPLMSTEGLLSIVLFAGFAISYEMVASVLVSSIFQSILITAAAMIPFVSRQYMKQETPQSRVMPHPEETESSPPAT